MGSGEAERAGGEETNGGNWRLRCLRLSPETGCRVKNLHQALGIGSLGSSTSPMEDYECVCCVICGKRLHIPSKSLVASTVLNNSFRINEFILGNSARWRVLCVAGTEAGQNHSTGASASHLRPRKCFKRCILFKMTM